MFSRLYTYQSKENEAIVQMSTKCRSVIHYVDMDVLFLLVILFKRYLLQIKFWFC